MNTRTLAAKVLIQVLPLNRQQLQPKSLSELLPPITSQCKDKGLLQEICFGVCRWYTRLDKLAAPLIQQPFKTKDADIHALLLVGLYQMFYLRIPDHAAIAETVESCRQLNKTWAVKVINGMLRSAQRRKQELEQQLPQSKAIVHAHPKWLVDALGAAWPQQQDAILKANNEAGPMCLRVNLNKHSRADYLQKLKQANIQAHPGELAPSALYLSKPMDVDKLPGFDQGWASVQDEAAQLSAYILDPQPGERILDACAAPGGKTGHILEQQPQLQQLIALDSEAKRLQRVADNLTRLNLQAELVHSSLQDYAAQNPEPFDRILLDAPCSATGVIRRHPDIKWLRKRSDIKALAETQLTLLQAAFSILKPGGTLLYATCSVMPQENQRVVGTFLQQQCKVNTQSIDSQWGSDGKAELQLFPTINAQDGFYYACLKRC